MNSKNENVVPAEGFEPSVKQIGSLMDMPFSYAGNNKKGNEFCKFALPLLHSLPTILLREVSLHQTTVNKLEKLILLVKLKMKQFSASNYRLGSLISCGLTRTIRFITSWKDMVCSSTVSSKIISIFVLRPRLRIGLFVGLGLFIGCSLLILWKYEFIFFTIIFQYCWLRSIEYPRGIFVFHCIP